MKIGNREFQTKGHTYVMGILNVTPDSFSDGGKWNDRDRALKHVEEMIAEVMDIVDIGVRVIPCYLTRRRLPESYP